MRYLLLLAFLLSSCFALRSAPEVPTGAGLLVSSEWLSTQLDNPEVVVLHVGRDRTSYDAGHIPGARYLPLSAVAVTRADDLNELPAAPDLKASLENVGVSDESHVILYGDLDGLAAARAFFALDAFGHSRVAILDGGLQTWKSGGRQTSTSPVQSSRGEFTPRRRTGVVVHAAEVNARRRLAQTIIVDARPAAQHTGTEPGEGVRRPGHIPGSVNRFWQDDLASDGTLLSMADLRERYAAIGVVPGRRVITYCRTGVQASHAYFVARYLGFVPQMYDASYLDWSNDTDYHVALGSDDR